MSGFEWPETEWIYKLVGITLLIAVPLALWKDIEVFVFLFTHVSISVG